MLRFTGAGPRLKAAWLGRREHAEDMLLWVRVDRLGGQGGAPAGKRVKGYRGTGSTAGDAAPGGTRRRAAALA